MKQSSKINSIPAKEQSNFLEKEVNVTDIPKVMISFKSLNDFNNLNTDKTLESPKDLSK